MSLLTPGQLTFVRTPYPSGVPRVAAILCDDLEPGALGRCRFKLRAKSFEVRIQSVTVVAIVVIVRMETDASERFYVGWVDELSSSGSEVLEALASQQQLTVWLTPLGGKGGASTVIPNVLRNFAGRTLDGVLEHAESVPWDAESFAAARALLEVQNSPAEVFWDRLTAES